jgi:hypothetical protein
METTARPRCWCGRTVPPSSWCGCCCLEHDEQPPSFITDVIADVKTRLLPNGVFLGLLLAVLLALVFGDHMALAVAAAR